VALLWVIEEEPRLPGALQVAGAGVVNCACAKALLLPWQFARTLQSYRVDELSPLNPIDVEVVADAALIQVPEEAAL
jgi:hypothetical protein